jgi:hypothetical protein
MKAEHHDLSGTTERTSLTDEDLYRAFEGLMGETDLTEKEQPKGGRVQVSGGEDGLGWTAWGPEPSEAAKRAEATKHHLARDARKDPAPEMSDDEVYEAVRAMTNWERD